ncbi:hypothetical protein C8J55DRAFT_564400 [Lentinula edodes]|uniref:Uncharacterized protein n=1 Tax=Lentinula lateritia TaxID=40482 RepID=A0A9W9DHL5_9AGAR|nr:hypothetical protein C8J55DRAFT_564400 [Lentinula edodes]
MAANVVSSTLGVTQGAYQSDSGSCTNLKTSFSVPSPVFFPSYSSPTFVSGWSDDRSAMRVFDILFPLITLAVRAAASSNSPPPSLHSDPNSYELSHVGAPPPSYSDIPHSPPPVYQPPPSYEHHREDLIYPSQSGDRNRPSSHLMQTYPNNVNHSMRNGTTDLELGSLVRQVDYNRRFGQCVCTVIGLAMVGVIAGVTATSKHSRSLTDNHSNKKCDCPKANQTSNVNLQDVNSPEPTRCKRGAARMSYRRRIRNWNDE